MCKCEREEYSAVVRCNINNTCSGSEHFRLFSVMNEKVLIAHFRMENKHRLTRTHTESSHTQKHQKRQSDLI